MSLIATMRRLSTATPPDLAHTLAQQVWWLTLQPKLSCSFRLGLSNFNSTPRPGPDSSPSALLQLWKEPEQASLWEMGGWSLQPVFLRDPQDSTSDEQEQTVTDGEWVRTGRGSPDEIMAARS